MGGCGGSEGALDLYQSSEEFATMGLGPSHGCPSREVPRVSIGLRGRKELTAEGSPPGGRYRWFISEGGAGIRRSIGNRAELFPWAGTVTVGVEYILEGQFSEPAELEITPKFAPIHFIWFGTGDPSAGNTAGPLALLQSIPNADIHYWCLDTKARVFGQALPGIRIRSIEGLLKEYGDRGVSDVLRFFDQSRIYAPGKDLVSFMVLALEGGYFFDANCDFGDGKGLLYDLFTDRPQPAFVAMKETLPFSEIDPASYVFEEFQALTSPYALFATREDPKLHEFPKTDMWTMYGPPGGSRAFATIVHQYVRRARRAGLLTGESERTGGQTDFVASLSGKVGSGKQRDFNKRATAGALAIQSIYAGIHSLGPRYDPVKSGFPCVNTGPESYSVSCLGLRKTHGGSW